MVNRMRSTRSHTGNRRSHHRLNEVGVSVCPDCNSPRQSHTACAVCGKYKGRVVLDVHSKMQKKEAKRKARVSAEK